MRSRLIRFAPAASVACSMRPSTCAGTPERSRCGAGPRRAGQFCRTRSWLPPIPPEVTTTACAETSNSPAALRSEEHTSELQSRQYLVCRLLLEKKKKTTLNADHADD